MRGRDRFYAPGEGKAGIQITATRESEGPVRSTTTWSSGGCSLELPPVTFQVKAGGGCMAEPLPFDRVVMGAENLELDLEPPPPPEPGERQPDMEWHRVAGTLTALLALLAGCASGPVLPCPPCEPEGRDLPRVVRFRSPATGAPAFGLVLEDDHGVPRRVLDLTARVPPLGGTLTGFLSHGGFELAEELWQSRDQGAPLPGVAIETADLLPPVDVRQDDLIDGRPCIVGVGFNYSEHARETAHEDPVVFAKPVVPTSAYHPVRMSAGAHVQLMDHEVELAVVLLEDVDLADPPPPDRWIETVAFLQANDVSDRVPIILDDETGFTAAKSDPTFLPTGPWMVHGRHLGPLLSPGSEGLGLCLEVVDAAGIRSRRQQARTSEMIRSPHEILGLVRDRVQSGSGPAMPDREGRPWPLARREGDRLILPAGSLILTGTPAGTAIRAPDPVQALLAFVLGGFSMDGARRRIVDDYHQHRREMGFLQPGDRVEAAIDALGRQSWIVEREGASR